MSAEKDKKVYYSIGEVAEMLRLPVSKVRYWSAFFADTVKPFRNKKGDRFFTQRDITTLKKIYYLAEECGLSLRGVKARLDAERLTPKQPKPTGRPANGSQAAEPDPAAPVDDLAVKAEVIARLSTLRDTLREISKYL